MNIRSYGALVIVALIFMVVQPSFGKIDVNINGCSTIDISLFVIEGEVEDPLEACSTGGAFIQIDLNNVCNSRVPLESQSVKLFAYPSDESAPDFDCSATAGIASILSLTDASSILGGGTSSSEDAATTKFLGSIPVSEICPEGQFLGVLDLSIFPDDEDYTISAVLCENGEIAECNVVVGLKEDNSKSGGLAYASQDVLVFTEDCPQFTFEDPCSCEDPLNTTTSTGTVILFHDQLVFSPEAGFDIDGEVEPVVLNPLNEFYLDPEGTMVVPDEFEIPFNSTEGLWILDIWHSPSDGWQGFTEIPGLEQPFPGSNSCSTTVCEVVPTMGQWALFIMSLILSSIGLIYIRQFHKKAV